LVERRGARVGALLAELEAERDALLADGPELTQAPPIDRDELHALIEARVRDPRKDFAGPADARQSHVDAALALSPLDPLAYGMLGVRAFSHMVLDQAAEAILWAELWAERAARAPGAHALIEMIAAAAHALGGDEARARAWMESARRRTPGLATADFFRAFPFRDSVVRRRIAEALDRVGR